MHVQYAEARNINETCPAALSLLSSSDTAILGPTLVKKILQESCFLATWLEDSYKDKELLYIVWKLVHVALAIGELQHFK